MGSYQLRLLPAHDSESNPCLHYPTFRLLWFFLGWTSLVKSDLFWRIQVKMLLSVFLRDSLARRHLNCLSSYSLSLQVRAPRSTVQLLSEIPRSGLKSRGDWAFFSSGPLICGSVYLDQIETLLKIYFFSLAFNPGLARNLGLQTRCTLFYLMMFLLFCWSYLHTFNSTLVDWGCFKNVLCIVK